MRWFAIEPPGQDLDLLEFIEIGGRPDADLPVWCLAWQTGLHDGAVDHWPVVGLIAAVGEDRVADCDCGGGWNQGQSTEAISGAFEHATGRVDGPILADSCQSCETAEPRVGHRLQR